MWANNKELVTNLDTVIKIIDRLGNIGLVEGYLDNPSGSEPGLFFITGTFSQCAADGVTRFVCELDPKKEENPWRKMIEADIRFITTTLQTLSPAALFKYLPLLKSKYPATKIRELYFDPETSMVVTPNHYH